MIGPYVEAILLWHGAEPSTRAGGWLEDCGLVTLPMRTGLLIRGDRDVFEEVFGCELADAVPPVALPIPDALTEAVASIVIPGPRQIHLPM